MKAVILSTAMDDEDDDEIAVVGEVKNANKGPSGDDEAKGTGGTVTKLPSFDKFAAGMPPMVFESNEASPTGRFDKVLDILRQKKVNRGK